MNLKRQQIRSKQYTDAARGQSCTMCGADDGTIVAAHYSGQGARQLGKGAGIKAIDLAVADLCYRCHTEMDQYKHGRDDEAACVFMMAILKTIWRRVESGHLIVKGMK